MLGIFYCSAGSISQPRLLRDEVVYGYTPTALSQSEVLELPRATPAMVPATVVPAAALLGEYPLAHLVR